MILEYIKFLTVVIMSVVAIVIMITKIIELKLASLKLDKVKKENPKVNKAKARSTQKLSNIAILITLLLLCFFIFIGDLYEHRLSLIVVFGCSVAISLFIIYPLIQKIIDLLEDQMEINSLHVETTGGLVELAKRNKKNNTQ